MSWRSLRLSSRALRLQAFDLVTSRMLQAVAQRTKLTNNSRSYNHLATCYSQIALVVVASA